MRIVTLGAPGSGKRTQTILLANHYGLEIITSAELVKNAMAEASERSTQLRLLQQSGLGVTEDIVLGLLQERLAQPDLAAGFILDGFPRNLLQALTLDEILAEIEQTLDFVLLFHIENDTLMERLVGRRTCRSCGAVYNIYTHPSVVEDVCDDCGGRLYRRSDDTEETVSNRLHVFDHLTSPLVSHYSKQGRLLRIDADGAEETVFSRTREAMENFLKRPSPGVSRETTPEPAKGAGGAPGRGPGEVVSATGAVAQAAGTPGVDGPAASPIRKSSAAGRGRGASVAGTRKPPSPKRSPVGKPLPKKGGGKVTTAKAGRGAAERRAEKPGGVRAAAGETKSAASRGKAGAPGPAKATDTKPMTAKPRSAAKPARASAQSKPAPARPAAKRTVPKKATAAEKSSTLKAGKKKALAGKAATKKKTTTKKKAATQRGTKPAAKKKAVLPKRKSSAGSGRNRAASKQKTSRPGRKSAKPPRR